MVRFVIIALLWMYGSFGLLWWVQSSIDRMHLHAVESIGHVIATDNLPRPPGEADDADPIEQMIASHRVGVQDFDRLLDDRKELLRRLRILWISLTLVPLLGGAFYFARRGEKPEGATEE